MRVVCPRESCGRILVKARLDVYWCDVCNTAWLIHKLSYKSLEKASEICDDEALRQSFLAPLIGVPPKGRSDNE